MSNRCVLVYSRYPEPGVVKTRLIPSLSAKGAATVHTCCLRTTWARWQNVIDEDVVLVGTPDERSEGFASLLECRDGLKVWDQGPGDLGQRLTRGFDRAFGVGYTSVVAIGTDSPTLPESHMLGAFEALAEYDVALGPAEDGGYYLIGLNRFEPGLFRDVTWGSDTVLSTTLANVRKLGLSVGLLRPWYDVDTPADVDRLRRELRTRSELCPSEQELLRSLDALFEAAETDAES